MSQRPMTEDLHPSFPAHWQPLCRCSHVWDAFISVFTANAAFDVACNDCNSSVCWEGWFETVTQATAQATHHLPK